METQIRQSVIDLAELMKMQPHIVESGLLKTGSEFLGLFEDSNFSDRFQNLAEMKKELFLMVCEDLAMGAVALKSSVLGLQFQNGLVRTFISPYGSVESRQVICSVSIRQVAAFKNWRNISEIEFQQEDLHAALYFMTHVLSEHFAKNS